MIEVSDWLRLVLAAAYVLLSIQMCRWYLEAADPYPPLSIQLPYLAEKDETREDKD